jgi:predicted secreted Zn-dependent protease
VIALGVLAFQVAAYTLPTLALPSNVSEESDIVWYPVSGTTLAHLRAQMYLHGPRDGEGVHAGYTHGYTHWHVTFTNAAGACLMRTVEVTASDTVTLPLWTPPPGADPAVVAEWSRFVTMLGRHEEGHREINVEGAGTIARALAALPSRASCQDLLASVNDEGHAILASTQERQAKYDQETNHGLRRGTFLENLDAPPPRIPPALIVILIAATASGTIFFFRSRAR